MYDLPELRSQTDMFWQAIRTALGHGPRALTRDANPWDIWQSPDLLLSQTCGYPYRARLHTDITLVGTPDYNLPGCPPGYYNSVFVVRADDPRNSLAQFDKATFAFNEPLSQSGWAAPMTAMRAIKITPGALIETGTHRASTQAVAHKKADLAAIDAMTWTLLTELTDMTPLREITRTLPTPGLPYICATTHDPAPLRRAIQKAITELPATTKSALHLHGLIRIPAQHYLDVPNPPSPSQIHAHRRS